MATPEAISEFRSEHGLDRPLIVQYLSFIGGILRGDLGKSVRYEEPVLDLFLERVSATLQLGLAAYLVAIVVGISAGVYSGYRAGSILDKSIRVLVLIGQAVPGFYLGLMLIIIFAVELRWFPTGGRGGFRHLVLPTITLSAYLTTVVLRFTRSAMIDVLHQDYIRTARGKGVPEKLVLLRHAFRNVLIPIVTILGVQSRVVLTGAVVTETVFSWPGIGRLTVQAIQTRDFPMIQGNVFIITCMVVFLNLAVDLMYGYLDPRIKVSGAR